MSSSRAARRYSKALLNLCGGNGSTEAVVGSLEKFAAVVRASPEIVEVLDDPSIDNEARQRTLHKLVPKLGIGGHAANLQYLLGERRRLREVRGDAYAQEVAILYGGSVKPDNAAELLAVTDVDGVLVGGEEEEFPTEEGSYYEDDKFGGEEEDEG